VEYLAEEGVATAATAAQGGSHRPISRVEGEVAAAAAVAARTVIAAAAVDVVPGATRAMIEAAAAAAADAANAVATEDTGSRAHFFTSFSRPRLGLLRSELRSLPLRWKSSLEQQVP